MTPARLTLTSQRGPFLLKKAHALASIAEENSGDVDATILLAAAGVEAFLNDLKRVEQVNNHPEPVLNALATRMAHAEAHRLSPLKKLERAYAILQGAPSTTTQPAFAAFNMLVALRNELIHYKPISGSDRSLLAAHPYAQYFARLGLVPSAAHGYGGHLTWDRVVLVPAVARWAYNTALRTVQLITTALPTSLASSELSRVWQSSLPALFAGV